MERTFAHELLQEYCLTHDKFEVHDFCLYMDLKCDIFLKCENIHDERERLKYMRERKGKHKDAYTAMRKKCERTLRKFGIY